jgi:nicotinamide phosphoribosyltransferase
MKATYAKINNEEKLLFKDPKTDPGSIKKSQKGLVHVHRNSEGTIEYTDNLCQDEYAAKQKLHPNLLTDLFVDGKLVRTTTLAEIRSRIEENLKFGKVKI